MGACPDPRCRDVREVRPVLEENCHAVGVWPRVTDTQRAGSWKEEGLIVMVPAELGSGGFGLSWEISSKK